MAETCMAEVMDESLMKLAFPTVIYMLTLLNEVALRPGR